MVRTSLRSPRRCSVPSFSAWHIACILPAACRGVAPTREAGAAVSSSSAPVPIQLLRCRATTVRPEHAVALLRLLGGGVAGDLVGLPRSQLAVLPGTIHVTLVERASWLVSMITQLLATPMPAAQCQSDGDPCKTYASDV